jgi:hypothetical protein
MENISGGKTNIEVFLQKLSVVESVRTIWEISKQIFVHDGFVKFTVWTSFLFNLVIVTEK